MFPTVSSTNNYADVFIESNSTLAIVAAIMLGIGFLIVFIGYFSMDFEGPMAIGALLAITGLVGMGFFSITDFDNKEEIVKNMSSNVETKFNADLKFHEPARTFNLDTPREYTLVFENGSSAEYTMYFKKTGEPVIVDEEKAPTAKELNEEKEISAPEATKAESSTKTTPPKVTPTPSELEESSKK
jgi:hypothetical protein